MRRWVALGAALFLAAACSGTDETGGTGGAGATATGGSGATATGGGGSGATGGGGSGPAPTVSDPVTTRRVGSHDTYDVGPGQPYEEPDTVPWGALVAGDVVNIHHRATPYAWKLCLRGQGTPSDPIVVHGVTDASGNRPVFDFNGARTASGCNPGGAADIFDTASVWSLEDYAGFIVRAGVSDPYGYKPAWIVIANLELTGAAPGNSFVSLTGATTPYIGSPAGIWLQPSADVLLENNVIHDHGFGFFTMAKDATLEAACERITVRSNRVYGNGVVGSYYEHNLYVQSTNPVVEGNYFGLTRAGSLGSTYKSRSSGEIFRYNWVEASARAIDWVYSEDQTPGIATQSDYGVDYAYGNVVVNDCSLGNCAGAPIHYGGDNLGEQDDTTNLFVPTTPYRSHLFFYANTVVNRLDSGDSWRTAVFDLSERATRVDAWDNLFYFAGTSNYSWVQSSGDVALGGTNLAFGATVADASDLALAVNYTVTVGTLLMADPLFVAPGSFDFGLGAGSGAIDQATGVPAGITPDAGYAQIPVALAPVQQRNGLVARTLHGAALDLGALEGP
ncbi:MAG: right-handed parallel beta-helix repeat-containing protein [Polyangiaceae bacterium]|nr:right-handed parallel beta-helix repeat-containing protein [Polyangiaceae bacterium]